MATDWSVFDGFVRPIDFKQRSWASVDEWTMAVESLIGADRKALERQRVASDHSLHDLSGDPSARDWTAFLLLRRDREEDWSDWLAQLIGDSETGRFAWVLFGAVESQPVASYVAKEVHREVLCEGYRADLVVEWQVDSYTHIEVKVGDPDLAKTLGTAEKMSKRFGPNRRSDAVLLLPSQQESWGQECARQQGMGERVECLTWIDVARALRSALPEAAGEPIHWRVWAHAFCGAIEQDLLGMRSNRDAMRWANSLTFQGLEMATQLLTPTETKNA